MPSAGLSGGRLFHSCTECPAPIVSHETYPHFVCMDILDAIHLARGIEANPGNS
jgi:hypothetical protein